MARFAAAVLIGALAFAALGLGATVVVPNPQAAPVVVNAMILPLLFLSGIFIPLEASTPEWVRKVGSWFPVIHFADAMRAGFYGLPFVFEWSDLLSLGAWGGAGLAIAIRTFRWEPRR